MIQHTRSPGINAMIDETPPGCCICCSDPLPEQLKGGRRRRICRDIECKALYSRVFCIDRNAGALLPPLPPKGPRNRAIPYNLAFLRAVVRMSVLSTPATGE